MVYWTNKLIEKYLPYILVYLIISGASIAVLFIYKVLRIQSNEYLVFLNFSQVTTSFALFSLPTLIQIESGIKSQTKVSIDKLVFQIILMILISLLYVNLINERDFMATLAVVIYGTGTMSCYNILYNWLSRNDLSFISRFLIIPFIETILLISLPIFVNLSLYPIVICLGLFKLSYTLNHYTWCFSELYSKYLHYVRFGSVLAINSFMVSSIIGYDKLLFTETHKQFYHNYVSNYFYVSVGIAAVNLNNMYLNVELFKRKIIFSNFISLVWNNFKQYLLVIPLITIFIYYVILQNLIMALYVSSVLFTLQIRHLSQTPFLTAKHKEFLLISAFFSYVLSFYIYPIYIMEAGLLYITMIVTLVAFNLTLIILISCFGGKRYNASVQ